MKCEICNTQKATETIHTVEPAFGDCVEIDIKVCKNCNKVLSSYFKIYQSKYGKELAALTEKIRKEKGIKPVNIKCARSKF